MSVSIILLIQLSSRFEIRNCDISNFVLLPQDSFSYSSCFFVCLFVCFLVPYKLQDFCFLFYKEYSWCLDGGCINSIRWLWEIQSILILLFMNTNICPFVWVLFNFLQLKSCSFLCTYHSLSWLCIPKCFIVLMLLWIRLSPSFLVQVFHC